MSKLVSRKSSKNKTLETKEIESIRWKAVGLTYIFSFLLSHLLFILWIKYIDFDMPKNLEIIGFLFLFIIGYIFSNIFLTYRKASSFQWINWKHEIEFVLVGFSPILWIYSVMLFHALGKDSALFFIAYPIFVVVWIISIRLCKFFPKTETTEKEISEQIPIVRGVCLPTTGATSKPMMLKNDFIRKVRTDLFPKLDEEKFKKHKRNTVILVVIFFSVVAYWGYDSYQKNLLSIEKLCAIGVIGLVLIYIFYSRFKIKYVLKTKDQLFKWLNIPQIDFFGTTAEVIPANIIEKKLKEVCFLFGRLNIRGGMLSSLENKPELKDLLKVELDRDAFFVTETGLAFNRANAGVYEGTLVLFASPRDRILFDGILIEIKLDRIFSTPIVFRKRSFFTWGNRLQKVSLPRKDSYFDIYAWSEQDARNLYYQGVTSKLRRIKEIFKVKKIAASFYQDKLYIALYTEKDVFEPIKSRFHDIKQYETFYDEIVQLEKYCAQFNDI